MALPKKKPQVVYWRDRIDDLFTTVHACRAWDVPSNGVFLLVTRDAIATWSGRDEIERILEVKLSRREQAASAAFGHQWRRHLTDMQFYGWDDHLAEPWTFAPWSDPSNRIWTPAA